MTFDREKNVTGTYLEDNEWEIDEKSHFLSRSRTVEVTFNVLKCFLHRFKSTIYGISCLECPNYEDLLIREFEVNKAFRNQEVEVDNFMLFEILNYYRHMKSVTIYSYTLESERFLKSIKMKTKDSHRFVGDELWLSDFMSEMEPERNQRFDEIETLRNRICDENLDKLMEKR